MPHRSDPTPKETPAGQPHPRVAGSHGRAPRPPRSEGSAAPGGLPAPGRRAAWESAPVSAWSEIGAAPEIVAALAGLSASGAPWRVGESRDLRVAGPDLSPTCNNECSEHPVAVSDLPVHRVFAPQKARHDRAAPPGAAEGASGYPEGVAAPHPRGPAVGTRSRVIVGWLNESGYGGRARGRHPRRAERAHPQRRHRRDLRTVRAITGLDTPAAPVVLRSAHSGIAQWPCPSSAASRAFRRRNEVRAERAIVLPRSHRMTFVTLAHVIS
ncbi:hypothetical protein C8E95_1697 [Pseudonocardia autotrophica]|uniref:Uncharacterized protein n=1 Tax=Pseudonocardia autotrophica TaxID=2074 RepID=A0A1Y2MGR3_PSEAH|nr:hypothetical protein BG845_06825 [Pseudonocardia autotrophica]TDN72638.1 hypothetical protein C8E95_1697 [Pseudonocardia autotrophica]